MYMEFEKWHGCANDFAVVWMTDIDGDVVLGSLKRQAKSLCDRHYGIGADGLLVLHTKTSDDLTPYKLTIINSDGSIAKNCGNGLRCACLSVVRRHDKVTNDQPEAIELEVEGELKVGRFFPNKVGSYPYVAVDMGIAVQGQDLEWFEEAKAAVFDIAKRSKITISEVYAASVGNPHIVIQVPQASREIMLAFGPPLQAAGTWDGINVHVISEADVGDSDQKFAGNAIGGRVSEAYLTYVWERGAGETMACGSGACAVAAAILEQGLTERKEWIGIDMPGGRLYAKQESSEDPVVLAGPAVLVYEGQVEIQWALNGKPPKGRDQPNAMIPTAQDLSLQIAKLLDKIDKLLSRPHQISAFAIPGEVDHQCR